MEYTNEKILGLIKDDKQIAYSYLYDKYAPALNGIIYSIIKDKKLSEELLVNVFLQIFSKISDYGSNQIQLFTWLHKVALNVVKENV